MHVLLDTHTLAYAVGDAKRLGKRATSLAGMFSIAHKDPLDRLLVAQAVVESVPILSADRVFDVFPVRRIW